MTDELDRRTKSYKDLIGMVPATDDLFSEEIDGERYLYVREPRCKVCKAPEHIRDLIDTLLLFPKTYEETLRLVTPALDGPAC